MRPARLQCGVSVSDVALRARQLSSENLRMHFLSPTRLVSKEQVLHHPNLTVLLLRMAQRLEHLCQEYGQPGDTRNAMGRDWYLEIKKQATEVRVIEDNTHWVHVRGYSNRQHQGISLSGIMGEAIFSGSTAELNELLVWGELLRVGKHIVKGAGYYCLGKG